MSLSKYKIVLVAFFLIFGFFLNSGSKVYGASIIKGADGFEYFQFSNSPGSEPLRVYNENGSEAKAAREENGGSLPTKLLIGEGNGYIYFEYDYGKHAGWLEVGEGQYIIVPDRVPLSEFSEIKEASKEYIDYITSKDNPNLLRVSQPAKTTETTPQPANPSKSALKDMQYPWEGATDPANLVKRFYEIALGLVGAAALGVLIYGSIVYSLSGAVTSKQDAMEWISGALWGLALLLGAWLILNTINPQLVNLQNPNMPASSASGGTSSCADQKSNLNALKSVNVDVVSTGDCCDANKSTCTSLDGMPECVPNALNNLKKNAGVSTLTVTGANEQAGHSSHGPGKPIVDLSNGNPKLNNYIVRDGKPDAGTVSCPKTNPASAGRADCQWYTMNDGTRILDEKNHWHVEFTKSRSCETVPNDIGAL
jgi:hypothetical protein